MEGKCKPVGMIKKSVEDLLKQWRHAKESQSVQDHRRIATSVARWTRPETGWIKCNIDVAIFNQEGYMGYGWVIKNEEGIMIALKNGVMNGLLDPTMVEARSCRKALS